MFEKLLSISGSLVGWTSQFRCDMRVLLQMACKDHANLLGKCAWMYSQYISVFLCYNSSVFLLVLIRGNLQATHNRA
jgi:hypothetical protein